MLRPARYGLVKMLAFVGKRAMVFAGTHVRLAVPPTFARLMSADVIGDAKAQEDDKEPEKPKRVSKMPDLKTRLQQDRLYKEVTES